MISALVTLLYAIVLRFVPPPKWSKKQKIGDEVFFFFFFPLLWMDGRDNEDVLTFEQEIKMGEKKSF